MSEQTTPNLGGTPPDDARRDAVHVAVAPVIAGDLLFPGDEVGPLSDGTFGKATNPIGVVDPFLRGPILGGDRFWLLLFPGTITSLRHVWTHPAFTVRPPQPKGQP